MKVEIAELLISISRKFGFQGEMKVFGMILVFLMFFNIFTQCNFSFSFSLIVVPDNFPTIQKAVDAANPYTTIFVKNGVYRENIKIKKPITLLGEGTSTIIEGDGDGHVVDISNVSNVTFAGFLINGSGTTKWAGIHTILSSNIIISNTMVVNSYRGIYMWDSSGCILRNNSLKGNTYNFEVWGLTRSHFLHDIDESNKIDGKPIYYWIARKDCKIPTDAGYVGLIECSNVLINNMNLVGNGQGILLAYTNNSIIADVSISFNIRGIHAISSSNITIRSNTIRDNVENGILLVVSCDNMIVENNIKQNKYGIQLDFSPLLKERSNNNVIAKNILENNDVALILSESSDNNITYNKIIRNAFGVWIDKSNDNIFFRNNFMENKLHVKLWDDRSSNIWNAEYPYGGNNWDDYSGLDNYRGVFQNETGSDLVGDEPYVINLNNVDRYPLLPLRIDFTYQPFNPRKCEIVNFSGRLFEPFEEIVSWVWEFSDGSYYLGQNISHRFSEDGNYSITLSVCDKRGVISVISKVVCILPAGNVENYFFEKVFVVFIIAIVFVVSSFLGYKKFKAPKWRL